MKTSRIVESFANVYLLGKCCLVLLLMGGLFAFAEEPSREDLLVAQGLRPVSSGLPQGVVRLRAPLVHSSGNRGFTASGAQENMGFDLSAWSQTFALEAGFTSRLSGALSVPVFYQNDLALDAEVFRKSGFYQSQYTKLSDRISDLLIEQGVCGSRNSCRGLISQGYRLPYEKSVELSPGETVNLSSELPVSSYLDAIIVGAVRPEQGRTGIGDAELSAQYTISDLREVLEGDFPYGLSLGTFLRIPTGAFADVTRSQRPLGKGTTGAGLRVGADFLLQEHTLLSVQYSAEFQLQSGKIRRSKISNSREFSQEPAKKYSQSGPRQNGYIRLEYNLGGVLNVLSPISAEFRVKIDSEPESKRGSEVERRERTAQSLLFGGRYQDFATLIPFALGALYEYPILSAGELVFVVPENLIVYGELYYRL